MTLGALVPADKPTAPYFVDTNVWLYALIVNDDAPKHQIAVEIIKAELDKIARLVYEHEEQFLEKWDEFFSD